MPDTPEDYTSAMRIFGGFSWGTLMTLTIGSVLIIIPQVPRPWLWGLLPFWGTVSLLGIALQWNVARGDCPKCGTAVVVPTTGLRCKNCRTFLKSDNRQVKRMK